MESEDDIVLEILKVYQKKYGIISEIHRLTEELGNLLSRDDRISTQIILNMRQEEMDKAHKCNHTVALLEDALDVEQRQHLKTVMDEKNGKQFAVNSKEEKLYEIYKNTREVLARTVELDKRINKRLAGDNSYYK